MPTYTEKQKEDRRRAHRNWIERNPGIRKKYYAAYDSQRNPRSNLLRASKDRARQNGIPHDITIEDIIIPENCPICGVSVAPCAGSRGGSSTSPSLDKLIPLKGYVKGNVAVICKKCNSMKGDASVELLNRMINYIIERT